MDIRKLIKTTQESLLRWVRHAWQNKIVQGIQQYKITRRPPSHSGQVEDQASDLQIDIYYT
jgi:hypothetical protein